MNTLTRFASTSLLLLVLAGMLFPLPSSALSCAGPDYSKFVAEGGGVAVGTVTAQEELGVITNEYSQQVNKVRITFDLTKAWGAALPKQLVAIQHVPVAVAGDTDIWGFRARFTTGQKYVVYVSRIDKEYRVSIGGCSSTNVYPADNLTFDTELAQLMRENGLGSGYIPTGTVTVQVSGAAPPLPNPPSTCPQIYRSLSRGSRGSDVMALQQYFVSVGVLGSSSVTGYFGPVTEGAVQEWQSSHGIISSGSPSSTGWGVVGPRTRVALAQCW